MSMDEVNEAGANEVIETGGPSDDASWLGLSALHLGGLPLAYIPPPKRFVKKNISAFLVEYEVYMVAYGKEEGKVLAGTVVFFLDRDVWEALMGTAVFEKREWVGIKKWLRDRYWWYDEWVGRVEIGALTAKRSYNSIHDYLRDFEWLASKLDVTEELSEWARVNLFMKGLKEKDFEDLMLHMEDEAMGNIKAEWAMLEEEVGKLAMQ